MIRVRLVVFFAIACGAALLGSPVLGAQQPAAAPDLQEVLELIRQNLPRTTDAELNRSAVNALVTGLAPRVMLVAGDGNETAGSTRLVTRTNRFDDGIAYVRVGSVARGLSDAVRAACDVASRSGSLKGLVLDLRFTGGEDYAAAAALADVFVRKERPLLNWGTGVTRAEQSGNELEVPVAVLINRQTSQAAEALAGALREAGVGLLLGSATAGRAMVYKEFPLKNGDRLRIAVGQVQLGDGSDVPAEGVKPDIAVEVSPTDENAYYADAFRLVGGPANVGDAGSTNRRVRINEAELVRERREGPRGGASPPTARRLDPPAQVVYDPALARALDVLKGLAVVRQSRS